LPKALNFGGPRDRCWEYLGRVYASGSRSPMKRLLALTMAGNRSMEDYRHGSKRSQGRWDGFREEFIRSFMLHDLAEGFQRSSY